MFARHLWITLAEDRPEPHLVYKSLRNIWNIQLRPSAHLSHLMKWEACWILSLWCCCRCCDPCEADIDWKLIDYRLLLFFSFSFHRLSVHKHLSLGSQTGWHTLADHHCLWWGRLTTLTSLTHLASLTQQPDCTECEKPAKYSWLIIWREREKTDSLSCVLIFEFPVMCIHPESDW